MEQLLYITLFILSFIYGVYCAHKWEKSGYFNKIDNKLAPLTILCIVIASPLIFIVRAIRGAFVFEEIDSSFDSNYEEWKKYLEQ